MRLAMLTLYWPNYQALADLTLPNWRRYCAKQGYELDVHCGIYGGAADSPIGNKIGFQKIQYLYDQLFVRNLYDAVWVVDLDLLVTNHTIRFEQFLDTRHSYYLNTDWDGVNNGSFIVRNTAATKQILEYMLARVGTHVEEQSVIKNGFYQLPFRSDIKILEHPGINSLLCSLYPEHYRVASTHNWSPGQFALHTPGITLERRLSIFSSPHIQSNIVYDASERIQTPQEFADATNADTSFVITLAAVQATRNPRPRRTTPPPRPVLRVDSAWINGPCVRMTPFSQALADQIKALETALMKLDTTLPSDTRAYLRQVLKECGVKDQFLGSPTHSA